MDSRFFQLPAAASILIFFAILISLSGAFSYFLQSWSIPFLVVLFFVLNLLYQYNVIDPSNKAYGLNYTDPRRNVRCMTSRPYCNCAPIRSVERDKAQYAGDPRTMEGKADRSPNPCFILINTSGGGNRSATFTMNILQRLDSLSGGQLMRKTFLITGASGGMFGAAYFRALSRQRDDGQSFASEPAGSSICGRYLRRPAQPAVLFLCGQGSGLSRTEIQRGEL